MKPLIIKGTEYSPEINLNPDEQFFQIAGESRPEDAGKLYGATIKWLGEYFSEIKTQKMDKEIKFEFKLSYFNTVSAKYILEILRELYSSHTAGIKIKVLWFYKQKDEDIKEAGDEYARLVNIPFEFICI